MAQEIKFTDGTIGLEIFTVKDHKICFKITDANDDQNYQGLWFDKTDSLKIIEVLQKAINEL